MPCIAWISLGCSKPTLIHYEFTNPPANLHREFTVYETMSISARQTFFGHESWSLGVLESCSTPLVSSTVQPCPAQSLCSSVINQRLVRYADGALLFFFQVLQLPISLCYRYTPYHRSPNPQWTYSLLDSGNQSDSSLIYHISL